MPKTHFGQKPQLFRSGRPRAAKIRSLSLLKRMKRTVIIYFCKALNPAKPFRNNHKIVDLEGQ